MKEDGDGPVDVGLCRESYLKTSLRAEFPDAQAGSARLFAGCVDWKNNDGSADSLYAHVAMQDSSGQVSMLTMTYTTPSTSSPSTDETCLNLESITGSGTVLQLTNGPLDTVVLSHITRAGRMLSVRFVDGSPRELQVLAMTASGPVLQSRMAMSNVSEDVIDLVRCLEPFSGAIFAKSLSDEGLFSMQFF